MKGPRFRLWDVVWMVKGADPEGGGSSGPPDFARMWGLSEFVELLPLLAWRRADQQGVGDFVVGDLFGGAIKLELGVAALGDDT